MFCFIYCSIGHETTASSLTYAFYCLAKYPEVQQKCYEEIINTVGSTTLPTAEQCKNYGYLNWFINEVLRYWHPVGAVTPKIASEDTTVAGYHIPKGTPIFLNVSTLHLHDAWGDPLVFRPERFAPNASRPKDAYYPFGGGNRLCIGNYFSLLEQQIFLTVLLQQFELQLKDPKYEMVPNPGTGLVNPDPNFEVVFVKRQ